MTHEEIKEALAAAIKERDEARARIADLETRVYDLEAHATAFLAEARAEIAAQFSDEDVNKLWCLTEMGIAVYSHSRADITLWSDLFFGYE